MRNQRTRRRVQTIARDTLNRSLIDGEEEEKKTDSGGGMIPMDVEGGGDSIGLLESLTATSTVGSDVTLGDVVSSDSNNSSTSKGRSKSFAL